MFEHAVHQQISAAICGLSLRAFVDKARPLNNIERCFVGGRDKCRCPRLSMEVENQVTGKPNHNSRYPAFCRNGEFSTANLEVAKDHHGLEFSVFVPCYGLADLKPTTYTLFRPASYAGQLIQYDQKN